MLKIENQIDRSKLKKYFYINSSGWLDTVFWISLLLFWTGIGAVVCLICGVIKFAGVFKAGASSAEKLYDEVRKADVQYFRNRAVQVMGLVDEEMSLIDPIVASGFADEDAIKYGKEVSANDTKRNFLKIIFDYILSIPRSIWHFIKSFFTGEEIISQAIFMEGSDKKIRSSLASVEFIVFTEEQVLAYVCQYDIALGIILNEYTREVFYRDIDSVNYGSELLHIWSENKKKYRKVAIEQFRMTISSSNNIWASLSGEGSVLENQITAVKALVRSKKEEMK